MDVVGVVPIFMSAGAAALPALLAAVTSVAAVLLKPRELIRVCRQNPKTASISAGAVLLLAIVGTWWWIAPASARTSQAGAVSHYDWASVAQDILNEQRQGKRLTKIADAAASNAPYVLGRDFTRCAFDDGNSPRQLLPAWTVNYYSGQDDPAAMPAESAAKDPHFAARFFSSPAIAGKRIFAAGAYPDVADLIGVLMCIDADTGKQIWAISKVRDDYLKAFFSSPAVTQDGKYVLIGEGLHDNHDCKLRCFNANTGRVMWSVQTSLHIESSPAIFGDMVVVGCGAIEGTDGKATGDPGHVLAVRISDHKELWRQPVNDPESSPAIDDAGMVYIGSGFNGNALVAIRSESDEVLREKKLDRIAWRTPVAQPVTSAITIVGDLVIAGAGNSDFVYQAPNPEGYVVAVERATGKVRWQTKFPDAVLGTIAARDGKLICPVRTGEVIALDMNGKVLWHTPVSGKAPVLAGCAFTGKLVYAVSSDGWLAVIDATSDGTILDKQYLNDEKAPGEGKSLSGPQISNGRVIVGSETGGLRCFVGARSAE